MKTIRDFMDFYAKISSVKQEDRKILCDVIKNTINDCRITLETVDKESIDSVREYIKWLKMLNDTIEFAEDKYELFKQEQNKTDKLVSSGLRKFFVKNKDEKPMERLKRLREEWALQPR